MSEQYTTQWPYLEKKINLNSTGTKQPWAASSNGEQTKYSRPSIYCTSLNCRFGFTAVVIMSPNMIIYFTSYKFLWNVFTTSEYCNATFLAVVWVQR
jgi:hypothetical protein